MLKSKTLLVLQFKDSNGNLKPTLHYFFSVGAIYEQYSEQQIGSVIGTVYNAISKNEEYENKKVYIKKDSAKALFRSRG